MTHSTCAKTFCRLLSTRQLLQNAAALAPMAVAFWLLTPTLATEPIAVLELPFVFAKPEPTPMNVLPFPVVLPNPAELPVKVLEPPNVLATPAELPLKVLEPPEVFTSPADFPVNVF